MAQIVCPVVSAEDRARLVHNARRKSGCEFVLLRSGTYQGKPVIASYHLSARLSRENHEQIARELAGLKVSLVGPSK